jgi:hypothetical protein
MKNTNDMMFLPGSFSLSSGIMENIINVIARETIESVEHTIDNTVVTKLKLKLVDDSER